MKFSINQKIHLPLAANATIACDVPLRLFGTASDATIPNMMIGPYNVIPRMKPNIAMNKCDVKEST